MNCPNCGHPTNYHGDDPGDRWLIANTGDPNVKCQLTQVQATLAAQRHVAAVGLRQLDKSRWMLYSAKLLVEGTSVTMAIAHMKCFIRDIGIQRKRKSDR